jgi:NAD(P)-dependent dehydrogenase (short-subunit alcohol dehydrogenase family)
MSGLLEGKVAVVTGGGTGIGLAVAKRFVAEGASVVITGRRQAELDAAVKEIGPRASALRTDISKVHEIEALYAHVGERFGKLDIVCANAGGGELAPLGKITEAQVDKELAPTSRARSSQSRTLSHCSRRARLS